MLSKLAKSGCQKNKFSTVPVTLAKETSSHGSVGGCTFTFSVAFTNADNSYEFLFSLFKRHGPSWWVFFGGRAFAAVNEV